MALDLADHAVDVQALAEVVHGVPGAAQIDAEKEGADFVLLAWRAADPDRVAANGWAVYAAACPAVVAE